MQKPQAKYHPLTGAELQPIWVSPSGREFWPIMGGDDTVPPVTDPPKTDPPAGEKTLTQTEVNAIAAREKAQGKAAAERELADALGVPLEEAKAIIKRSKEESDAKKSEADKDREAAAREKQEAETEKAAAKKETHQARLERAFDKVGVDLSDDKEKAKNERLLRMVTAEVGASYEDVLAEVKQIQKDFPGLFGESTGGAETTTRKAPNGDPKGTPPKPSGGEDKYEAGRKRAEARRSKVTDNPLLAKLK